MAVLLPFDEVPGDVLVMPGDSLTVDAHGTEVYSGIFLEMARIEFVEMTHREEA